MQPQSLEGAWEILTLLCCLPLSSLCFASFSVSLSLSCFLPLSVSDSNSPSYSSIAPSPSFFPLWKCLLPLFFLLFTPLRLTNWTHKADLTLSSYIFYSHFYVSFFPLLSSFVFCTTCNKWGKLSFQHAVTAQIIFAFEPLFLCLLLWAIHP